LKESKEFKEKQFNQTVPVENVCVLKDKPLEKV
jgi:hypothetical protein